MVWRSRSSAFTVVGIHSRRRPHDGLELHSDASTNHKAPGGTRITGHSSRSLGSGDCCAAATTSRGNHPPRPRRATSRRRSSRRKTTKRHQRPRVNLDASLLVEPRDSSSPARTQRNGSIRKHAVHRFLWRFRSPDLYAGCGCVPPQSRIIYRPNERKFVSGLNGSSIYGVSLFAIIT